MNIIFEHEYVDIKGRKIFVEIESTGLRYIARRYVNCNESNICYSSTESDARERIAEFYRMSPEAI